MEKVFGITVVGLIVVFTVLSILMLLFYLLKFFSKEEKEVKIKKEITQAKPTKVVEREKREVEIKKEENEEIIAAIISSIQMYSGLKAFKILSVKRVTQKRSNWGRIPPIIYWRIKKPCK